MTVSEFIEWLNAQDQDAIITCIVHDSRGSYYEQGGTCSTEEFTPEFSEYVDFRDNQFVKPDAPYFNKRYLLIGGKD